MEFLLLLLLLVVVAAITAAAQSERKIHCHNRFGSHFDRTHDEAERTFVLSANINQ